MKIGVLAGRTGDRVMIDEILNIRHIQKSFPYGIVLDDISLNVIKGECMGIIGENGSGKSVLIQILAGELEKDQGEIYLEGRRYEPGDMSRAQEQGVYRIFQKSMLLGDMTAAENLICVHPFSGRRLKDAFCQTPVRFPLMTGRKINALAKGYLDEFGIDIAPDAMVKDLSPVEKKQVEFLKVILKNPKVLILDDIFSSLDMDRQPWFAQQIAMAKERGTAVVVVSQNLNLVTELCDRIAIMQDSQIVQVVDGDDIYLSSLLSVLRRGDTAIQRARTCKSVKKALEVRQVRTGKDIEASFSLYEGEVLGIYISDTLAADSLVRVLSGQEQLVSGEITVCGKKLETISLEQLADNKICVISGEDLNQMLLYEDTVLDNIGFFAMKRAVHYGIRNLKMERLAASELAAECGLSPNELRLEASFLSAGARQKLAFANSIALGTRIYILNHIMSHVDYQSQKSLYEKMGELKKDGASFLFIGKEFEELRTISDRMIYVVGAQISDRWFY